MPLDPELDFELSVLDDVDCTLISVAGELDVATTPELQEAIAAAIERALPIVVDASAVSFMDSTGLAGLLAMRNPSASGLRFVLRRPSPAVRRILELTGIVEILEIEGEGAD